MKGIGVIFCLAISISLCAQRYEVKKSMVSFFSEAAVENIAANNEKAVSRFDLGTGDIAFIINIQDFEFDKALMKEHFNEKYLESDKFPKSTFQGKVSGFDIKDTNIQNVTAKGKLTIHGQSKQITAPGTMQIKQGEILIKAEFIAELSDYKIKIPKLLWQNIAERVEVKLDFTYRPL